MKQILLITFSLLVLQVNLKSTLGQSILFQSNFENINFTTPDSLPAGWKKLDADSNFFGVGKSWAVRDTTQILGGDTTVNRPRAHSGRKSLHISWFAGKGGGYVSNDWVWTDSLNIHGGDSLIFWSLLGNTNGISYYVDSVQIWICSSQSVTGAHTHLSTIISNLDTIANDWTEHTYNLSQFSGQRIFIAFRYYLPVQEALWCNIDDMIIGNRSGSIGVQNQSANIPNQFLLSQNFPNPFNPVTNITYSIKSGSYVSLKIFDASGKEVSTLVDGKVAAGRYEIKFDASELSSGIYFYTLQVNTLSETRRMMLLK